MTMGMNWKAPFSLIASAILSVLTSWLRVVFFSAPSAQYITSRNPYPFDYQPYFPSIKFLMTILFADHYLSGHEKA
jgi:hypothetical protein